MKQNMIRSMLTLAITATSLSSVSNALARGGADNNFMDADRLIRCVDGNSGVKILEFNALQGRAQVAYASYDIAVQAIGDDVAEIVVTNLLTKNFASSNRSEPMLTVTVGSGTNGSVKTIVQALTRRGFAQASVADLTTGDQAEVQSQSRRGVSWMKVNYVPSDATQRSILVHCEKI